MIKIIDKRGTGKSSRLLLLAKERNAILICENSRHMRELADKYGFHGLEIYSYADVENCQGFDKTRPVVIDEISSFARFMSSKVGSLIGYTDSLEAF